MLSTPQRGSLLIQVAVKCKPVGASVACEGALPQGLAPRFVATLKAKRGGQVYRDSGRRMILCPGPFIDTSGFRHMRRSF
jgi:hypothetical protein